MFIVALVYAIFASTFTIGQAALKYTEPVFLIGLRMLLAGIFLLGYFFIAKRRKVKLSDVSILLQLSLFHIYVPYVTEFWGMQYIGSAKTAILYSISPFVTALFEKIFFKASLSKQKIVGLCIGLLGLIPVLMSSKPGELQFNHMFFLTLPDLAVLVSAISSCYGWLLLKKSVVHKGHSPIYANGAAMLIGGVLALFTSPFFENWNPLPTSNFNMTIFYIMLMILIGNFIYYNCYGWLLTKFSATFLSFFGFSLPLFAAFYQWVFFKECVSWQFFLTFIFTFTGLFIFYKDEIRNKGIKA